MDDFLSVKPGDPITADGWNQLLKSNDRANVLYGGENVRVTKLPHGTMLNAKQTSGFIHPWRVSVSTTSAHVQPGTINGMIPTIQDKKTGQQRKMTDRPPPILHLNDNTFNASGIGWVALEIQTDKNYRDIKTAKVVQCQLIVGSEAVTNNPFFYFGLPGIGDFRVRYALARLQKVGKGKFNVFQVAMFNLNWRAKPPSPQSGTANQATQGNLPRHFFWPA